MKAVIESWARLVGSLVLANTVYQSASRTPDIQHLVPLRIQPPPGVGHPAGAHAHDVAARLGLGEPEGGPLGPLRDARQVLLLLRLGAGDHDRAGREAGEQQHQGGRVGVLGHLFDGDGETENARARPAVVGRDAQPQESGVAERLEQILRVGALFVDGAGPRPDLVLSQAAHRCLQGDEFFGKGKIHRRRLPDSPAMYFLVLEPRRCT